MRIFQTQFVFAILVLKLVEFIQLVELDKYFIDSGIYCLWIVFFAHIVFFQLSKDSEKYF